MKYYGLFNVEFNSWRKGDKRLQIIKTLHDWFVDQSPLVKHRVRSGYYDADKRIVNARKNDYNMIEARDGRQSGQFRSVWFVHECDEMGFWKLTKGEIADMAQI